MRNRFLSILLLVGIAACNNAAETAPVTELEVAYVFINATFQNDIDKAELYILKDSTNIQTMELLREKNKKLTKEQLAMFKKANPIIREVSSIAKDSVVIISYSPSYKPETVYKLKMLRGNGKWAVDIKYTFL
jgi:DNA-directed RNA polymerase subunit H (RpoH/RPB5)